MNTKSNVFLKEQKYIFVNDKTAWKMRFKMVNLLKILA